MKYANIIVDISVEKLDKTFQYSIPENLQEEIQVGVQVDIPFGNRKLTGYVIELTEDAEFDPRRIRPIIRYMREAWQWNPSSLHWPDGCGRITVPP